MRLLRPGLLSVLALLAAASLAAQEAPPEVPVGPPAGPMLPAGPPSISVLEVVPQVLELEQETRIVRRQLVQLVTAGSGEVTVIELEEQLDELRERLHGQMLQQGPASGDAILLSRRRIEELRAELSGLIEEVGAQAASLGELIESWRERQGRFAHWQQALLSDPAYPSIEPRLASGQRQIAEVLAELDKAVPAVVGRQQHLRSLVLEAEDLMLTVRRLRNEWRRGLTRRGEPALWQPVFGSGLVAASREGLARSGAFFDEVYRPTPAEGWRLVLALILAVAVSWGLHRFQRWAAPEDPARRLLAHPGAVAFFLGVLVAVSARPFGAGWPDLVRAGLLAASITLLTNATQPGWHRRLAVHLMAGGLLLQAGLEAFGVAAPVYRLIALGFVGLAVSTLLLVGRTERRRCSGRRTPFLVVVRLAVAGLVLVALAEVVGYHALARWLWKSLLGSFILLFVAHFLIRLTVSLLRLAMSSPASQSRPLLARLGPELERRVGRVVQALVILFGLLTAADFWDLVDSPWQAWEKVTALGFSVGESRFTLASLLMGAGALYASLLLSWLLRVLFEDAVGRKGDFDLGVRESAKTLLHYSLITVGLLLALSLAGVDLRNVTILAGALGVGLGFGLQNIFNNFVSGMILLFERPVRHGDVVVVGGDLGTVRRIGLRSTVVETLDGAELVVPNSQLISEKFTNWTLTSRTARLVVPVGVAYGSDLARVREVLHEVAASTQGVLAEPPPVAIPLAFADSAIQCELRVWVSKAEDRPRMQGDLIEQISRRFAEEGITIAFPQLDVRVWNESQEER